VSFLSDYTEKNSNLIPKIDIPCFAWNSQAEQGLLFFKAKSLIDYHFKNIRSVFVSFLLIFKHMFAIIFSSLTVISPCKGVFT